MQSLEAACEEAERILHMAKRKPSSAQFHQEKNGTTFKSIHQKLREIYEEECAKDNSQPYKNLKSSSHLLEKLVARENLNTLVINLFPENKGYSIMVRTKGGKDTETQPLPYDNEEFLEYIDNEEIPMVLIDLLEEVNEDIFYSGCVIAEIRDYRHSVPHYMYETHHVLLRPTTQSLLGDINYITKNGEWTTEERLALESQLVLATHGPLCLDPSPALSIVANRLQYHKQNLGTTPLRRCARKFSQVSVNRKRKLDQLSAQPNFQLYDFISRRKSQTRNVPTASAKLSKKPSESVPSMDVELSVPEVVDVLKYAKCFERPTETNDCTPQLVEEYILETERAQGRIYHIKLTILQRLSNHEYLGELYVDRDHKEGVENGASCRFPLGTRTNANRYIQQFTEIFTEEGRKSVKITHIVPGQPARVTCTAGMRERDAKAAAALAVAAAGRATASTASVNAVTPVSPAAGATQNIVVNATAVPHMPAPQQIQLQPQQQQLQQQPAPQQPVVNQQVTSTKPVAPSRPVTNPAISALVTSLMNSAQQFQQAAAMNNSSAAAAASNSNLGTLNVPAGTTAAQALNQKFVTRKMTLQNLLNSRVNAASPAVAAAPATQASTPTPSTPQVRVTLSNLVSQLSSPVPVPPVSMVTTSRPQTSPNASTTPNASYTLSGYTVPVSGKVAGANISGRVPSMLASVANANSSLVNSTASSSLRRSSSGADSTTSNLGLSMPGLSALLAGTPSADNPIPGVNSSSSLLERLTASSGTSYTSNAGQQPGPTSTTGPVPTNSSPSPSLNQNLGAIPGFSSPPPAPKAVVTVTHPTVSVSSPLSSPQPSVTVANLNLQGLNLASLQGAVASIPGLQNVQVSIPGLAVPISLSLNVSTSGVVAPQTSVLVTSLPVTSTSTCTTITSVVSSVASTSVTATSTLNNATTPAMVLANPAGGVAGQGQVLSLPVAQIMASGVKGLGQQQNIRTASPASVSIQQAAQQSIQLVSTLQKARGLTAAQAAKQAAVTRGLLNATVQRHPNATVKMSGTTASVQMATQGTQAMSGSGATLTLTAQQQLQLALQKQTQLRLQHCLNQQQKTNLSAAAIAGKHRRKSSSNEPK